MAAETGASVRLSLDGPPDIRPAHVLVIDADEAIAESCTRFLAADGFEVAPASRADHALHLLGRRPFEIVLLDLQVPGSSGLALLRAVRAKSPDSIVIVTTEGPSVDSSLAAFDAGAWDYLPKPFSAAHLQVLVGRAVRELRGTRRAGPGIAPDADEMDGGDIGVLGVSPSILKVIALARRVAITDASVFITGESGTGKERMAKFIHQHGRRAGKPLVAINCAAIPDSLIETEMFGHRKGAFTGAVEEKRGLLEAADGGSFFLDELIQMPLPTQAKLLRVIQDGVVRRVGSDSVNTVVDVRFIAATNESPEDAIRTGRLREDLYYRLRVFPIHLPPLRERRDDIPLLADRFLRLFWARHRPGTTVPSFSDGALGALTDHPWRGNVRELQNVIEHGVVLFEPGMRVEPGDIPFAVHTEVTREVVAHVEPGFLDGVPETDGFHAARERVLARFERRYLAWLVERAGGNLSKAARMAGVQRTTLYRLMEKHEVHRRLVVLPWEDAR